MEAGGNKDVIPTEAGWSGKPFSFKGLGPIRQTASLVPTGSSLPAWPESPLGGGGALPSSLGLVTWASAPPSRPEAWVLRVCFPAVSEMLPLGLAQGQNTGSSFSYSVTRAWAGTGVPGLWLLLGVSFLRVLGG